jgi:hypothetical protein
MYAAVSVLQKCFPNVMGCMHAYRVRALLGAVLCLLSCRRLILMDMARNWPGATRVRAPLKRLDRLLSNPRLAQEREALYAGMMSWLVRHPNPLILVDWSDLHGDCRWQLLRASIPMSGRAVTLFEMVFPEAMKGSPIAEKKFLKRLHALLPASVKPIVVSDAGFRSPWLQQVAGLGWYYVSRLRARTRVRIADAEWFDNKELHDKACSKAQRIENVQIVQSAPWRTDLVLYRKPRQGRKRLSVRKGTASRANTSIKAQRRESEPWVLVVCPQLRHLHPHQLVLIYSKRMQIEQSFRDLKCDRLGCGFKYSLTRDPKRIAILLLIHALATFVAWLAALSIAVSAQVLYGGVKSSRPRLHYSQLRIGWEALRRQHDACTAKTLLRIFHHPPPACLAMLAVPS